MPIAPGDLLAGKYSVERILGQGAFGTVVAAQHVVIGQRVAVKVLHEGLAQNRDIMERFLREARAVGSLKGEHVARVLDVGTLPWGTPYIVLEYLEGHDLASVLAARGPLPVPEAVDYVLQACHALAEAHALGIVHRDLKPANLFLTRSADDAALVKVLDFGISKVRPEANGLGKPGLTQSQVLLGSPLYMSPEQMISPRGVDARADVWSLGVILYELVSQTLPFSAPNITDLCVAIAEETPRRLTDVVPHISMRLAAVVERCLAKQPADRYADVVDLALGLAPLGGPRGPGQFQQVAAIHARASRRK